MTWVQASIKARLDPWAKIAFVKRNKPRYPDMGLADLVAITLKDLLVPIWSPRAQLLLSSGRAPFSVGGPALSLCPSLQPPRRQVTQEEWVQRRSVRDSSSCKLQGAGTLGEPTSHFPIESEERFKMRTEVMEEESG